MIKKILETEDRRTLRAELIHTCIIATHSAIHGIILYGSYFLTKFVLSCRKSFKHGMTGTQNPRKYRPMDSQEIPGQRRTPREKRMILISFQT